MWGSSRSKAGRRHPPREPFGCVFDFIDRVEKGGRNETLQRRDSIGGQRERRACVRVWFFGEALNRSTVSAEKRLLSGKGQTEASWTRRSVIIVVLRHGAYERLWSVRGYIEMCVRVRACACAHDTRMFERLLTRTASVFMFACVVCCSQSGPSVSLLSVASSSP